MRRWFNHFITPIHRRTSGSSRLSKQGSDDSEITFFVRPLHMKFQFLHPYTLKICLKMHVGVLKYLTFRYINTCFNTSLRFYTLIFQQGAHTPPLKTAYVIYPYGLCIVCIYRFIFMFSLLLIMSKESSKLPYKKGDYQAIMCGTGKFYGLQVRAYTASSYMYIHSKYPNFKKIQYISKSISISSILIRM